MSTIAPVVDAVADVKAFGLFAYRGALWSIYVRESGELELHRTGDAVMAHTSIDVPFRKRQPTATAIGDELCIAWAEPTSGAIFFSRWDLSAGRYSAQPSSMAVGSSPSIKVYKTTRLVLGYRDGVNRFVYRISANLGLTWSDEIVVDPLAITEVDIDVFPTSDNSAFFAETN
jgi:hypothetical protein